MFLHPSLRVIEASDASQRLSEARAWVAARADGPGVLIVSASRGAADDLARAVALARGGAIGLHRFSIAQLAARLAAPVLAARGIAPVSFIGGEAVAARATFEASQERRAGLLRPCRANSRIPTRARAHAPRADARESRRGRARFAAARRCRPRATSGTLRGSVRGGFGNRSRSAVRSGSGGRGSLSRVPAAPARCAAGLGGRVRFRHEADRRCPGCSRHDSVRGPCHAGSLQDPGTRASRSRAGGRRRI